MKAVFLDRDGTINDHTANYVTSWDQFRFLPNALEALKLLAESEYKIIVITNQTAVRRELMTIEDLQDIHERMVQAIADAGGRIDWIYACLHLPQDNCKCRKPKTQMLAKAAEKYDLDLKESWMIGDNTKDIKCGADAGLKTALVSTGWGGKDGLFEVSPDVSAVDILEAVRYILDKPKDTVLS